MFATRETARKFELLAARGLAYEALLQQRILQDAVNDSVRAFRDLHETGVCKDFLDEMLRGLHDAVTNADHTLRVTIDEADIYAEHLDLSELDALIQRVKS